MYREDELIPISAIQHLAFCRRQCALIHVENLWTENLFTAEGRLLHERVHSQGRSVRGDVVSVRGLALRSLRLGVIGQADVVEFVRSPTGVRLPELSGLWQPSPVEYKRGRPKKDNVDAVQLCCQALCLEEMLQTEVPSGALFYGQSRRRQDVLFDASLRTQTLELATELHELLNSEMPPPAEHGAKCRECSLKDQCLPKVTTGRRSARKYLSSYFQNVDKEGGTGR